MRVHLWNDETKVQGNTYCFYTCMQLRLLKLLKYAVLNAKCLLIVFVRELCALYHTAPMSTFFIINFVDLVRDDLDVG